MRRGIQIAVITAGVAIVFAAAELLPTALSHSADSRMLGQVVTLDDQTTIAGIAYELSFSDKILLLSAENDYTCTRVYHTDSLMALKSYDQTVMETLWEAIDTFNQMSAMRELLSDTSETVTNETDPVYIRLNRTDDAEAENCFDGASCVSVSLSDNAMGAMTVWVLTFRDETDTWQFLLDTAEKKLYAVWENDTQKNWSGYTALKKSEKGRKASVREQEIREMSQMQMASYYGGGSVYGSVYEADAGIAVPVELDDETQQETGVPFQSSCQLQDTETMTGLCLGYALGSETFYESLSSAVGEWKMERSYVTMYIENAE